MLTCKEKVQVWYNQPLSHEWTYSVPPISPTKAAIWAAVRPTEFTKSVSAPASSIIEVMSVFPGGCRINVLKFRCLHILSHLNQWHLKEIKSGQQNFIVLEVLPLIEAGFIFSDINQVQLTTLYYNDSVSYIHTYKMTAELRGSHSYTW